MQPSCASKSSAVLRRQTKSVWWAKARTVLPRRQKQAAPCPPPQARNLAWGTLGFGHPTRPRQALRVAPVAVLVLLAGAAGAVLVAADLAPASRVVGIARGRRHRGRALHGRQRAVGVGELILAGIGDGVMRLHRRQ